MGIEGNYNLPIEAYISNILGSLADDSVQDLRAVGVKVQQNMAQKAEIRNAQSALASFKTEFTGSTAANFYANYQRINEMRNALYAAGVPQDSKAMKELNSFPNGATKEKVEAWFKSMEAALDAEGQARSDLGQQLQLTLQEANNIFTRTSKLQSDMSSKWSSALDGTAQNIK